MEEKLIPLLITLLSVTNPVGNMAIFAGLTAYKTEAESKRIARNAFFAILIILTTIVWLGDFILKIFGITLPSFEIAGGIIIAIMGVSMLHSRTSGIAHSEDENEEAQQKEAIAIVPVAIPLVAGPGAIATLTVAVSHFPSLQGRLMLSGVCLAISLVIWFFLHFAPYFSHKLGMIGVNIVIRIMGIILTALAIEMISKGALEVFPALAS
ncbi:MAG: NAAT family transporter [Cytophagales bacterium]|nr:NAAT family transporter [Cytophagales bacterium]